MSGLQKRTRFLKSSRERRSAVRVCWNFCGCALFGVVALVQQWDAKAKKWNAITDLIQSDRGLINPIIMEDSMAYAKENKIEMRCN